jgi:hypothetical protein
VTSDLLVGGLTTGKTSKAAFEAFVTEPRLADTPRSRLQFAAALAACCTVAQVGLAFAYFG